MTRNPTTVTPRHPLVLIRGPVRAGERILRTPHPTAHRLKALQFWNPNGEDFELETEFGEWVQGLVRECSVEIVEPQPEKPNKPAPRKATDDKESR